ncbi:MAG TPA: hypothetical protein VEW93_01015 [Acidimicrobiales bacterium]|nr:hypothetical protein [Acidimicrobiales bacterium]
MELFEVVADALRGMVPPHLGPVHHRWHRYGVKVWFGPEAPSREHYEAQVVGARDVPGAQVLAVEVGFHAENRDPAANEAALALLVAAESAWRPELGDAPVAGPFLGRRDDWCRVSETWNDPDLGDEELGLALAARLTDYVEALEPIRRHPPA